VIVGRLQLGYLFAFIAMAFGTSIAVKATKNPIVTNLILNPSFERTDAQQKTLPIHWNIDVANKTETSEIVALDNTVRHCGSLAARVRFVEAMNYSGVIQEMDASKFVGKKLHFSGFLRRSSMQSIVGIWLLVADKNNNKLQYINSYMQPTEATKGWSYHSLSVRIPDGASTLKVGAAIYDKDGIMWVDDLHLSTKSTALEPCNVESIK
jgi:hypothetical protein